MNSRIASSSTRWKVLLVAVAVLAVSPLLARPPRGSAAPGRPKLTPADELLIRKQLAEDAKIKVEGILTDLRTSCARATGAGYRRVCVAELAQLDPYVKTAQWAYDTGNYDRAQRLWTALELRARKSALAVAKERIVVENCRKAVQNAQIRVRTWALKINRLKDPASIAECQQALAESERLLQAADAQCGTTEPIAVIKSLGTAIRPLDMALRHAK